MSPLWSTLAPHLAAGHPARLIWVADSSGPSPGTPGARMLVLPDGSTIGTIGGGAMEANVVARATEAMRERTLDRPRAGAPEATRAGTREAPGAGARGAPQWVRLQHRRGAEHPSGLICGGEQSHVEVDLGPADADWARRIVAAIEADAPHELVVGDGVDLVPAPLAKDRALRSFGESPVRYREQVVPAHRAVIYGGGHCGQALDHTLGRLGYHCTVVEKRDAIAEGAREGGAANVWTVADYAEAADRIPHPEVTHAIVMTSDYPSDVRALLGLLSKDRNLPFIGVMGSRAKLVQIRAALTEAGIPAERCAGWYAPIGLEMVSNTPEEIAISVAGQLLRERPALFPAWR